VKITKIKQLSCDGRFGVVAEGDNLVSGVIRYPFLCRWKPGNVGGSIKFNVSKHRLCRVG
jgi:hypothetical protein